MIIWQRLSFLSFFLMLLSFCFLLNFAARIMHQWTFIRTMINIDWRQHKETSIIMDFVAFAMSTNFTKTIIETLTNAWTNHNQRCVFIIDENGWRYFAWLIISLSHFLLLHFFLLLQLRFCAIARSFMWRCDHLAMFYWCNNTIQTIHDFILVIWNYIIMSYHVINISQV